METGAPTLGEISGLASSKKNGSGRAVEEAQKQRQKYFGQ